MLANAIRTERLADEIRSMGTAEEIYAAMALIASEDADNAATDEAEDRLNMAAGALVEAGQYA